MPEFTFETIILFAGAFLLGVLITRWIFSIDRQIKNQRAIIWLLKAIAEKQGVTKESISLAMQDFQVR